MLQQNGLELIGAGYFIWSVGFLKRYFGFASLYSRNGDYRRANAIRTFYGRAAVAAVYGGLVIYLWGGLK